MITQGQQVFGKLLLLLLFTVDSNCYLVAYQELLTIRVEPGCVPEEENLVAYQKKEPGCVPEEENLVAYQKKEPGCVPEEGNLVAYQKKRTWLRTRRRNISCVLRFD